MRNSRLMLFVVSLAVAEPLAAQTAVGVIGAPQPDSAQMAAMLANSMRMLKPAVFVLDHKADLALSPEQLQFLEFLVGAERDSAVVRNARMMKNLQEMVKRPPTSPPMNTWTGTIDEQRIRDEACQRSLAQVDIMLGLMRDRHAVGSVLTEAQLAQLSTLEGRDMMNAMKPKPKQP